MDHEYLEYTIKIRYNHIGVANIFFSLYLYLELLELVKTIFSENNLDLIIKIKLINYFLSTCWI